MDEMLQAFQEALDTLDVQLDAMDDTLLMSDSAQRLMAPLLQFRRVLRELQDMPASKKA